MLRSRNLQKFVGDLLSSPLPQKCVVITLMSRTSTFEIVIKLKESDFDFEEVRTPTVLCLLGLGIGVGSVLIYRLFRGIFTPSPTNSPSLSRRDNKSTASPNEQLNHNGGNHRKCSTSTSRTSSLDLRSYPQTPSDSGISSLSTPTTMGNNFSDASAAASPNGSNTVYYNSRAEEVRLRKPFRDRGGGGDSTSRQPAEVTNTNRAQRPLSIAIPTDETVTHPRLLSSTSSDFEGFSPDINHASFDALSIKPNYSPTSLCEKNLRITDDIESPTESELEKDFSCESLNQVSSSTPRDPLNVESLDKIVTRDQASLRRHYTDTSRTFVHGHRSDTHANHSQDAKDTLSLNGDPSKAQNIKSTERPDSGVFECGNLSEGGSPPDFRHSTSSLDTRVEAKRTPAFDRLISAESSPRKSGHTSPRLSSSNISISSDLSETYIEATFRNHSLDLSENNSGMATPDSDTYNPGSVGLRTVAEFEKVGQDIQSIQSELEEMSEKLRRLSSREEIKADDLGFHSQASKDKNFEKIVRVLHRHKSKDHIGLSRSQSDTIALEQNRASTPTEPTGIWPRTAAEGREKWRHSLPQSADYVWDFAAEAIIEEHSSEHRPQLSQLPIGSSTEETPIQRGRGHSPSLEHIRAYLRSLDSNPSHDPSDQDSTTLHDLSLDGEEQVFDETSLTHVSNGNATASDQSNSNSTQPPPGSPHAAGVDNVGPLCSIPDYIHQEFELQHTQESRRITKGYTAVKGCTGCTHLRQICPDNYCVIRATIYQCLLSGLPLLKHWGSRPDIIKKLEIFQSKSYSYLNTWSFGRYIAPSAEDIYHLVNSSVNCLLDVINEVEDMPKEERGEYIANKLNSERDLDICLCEAVKVMMMVNVADLHQRTLSSDEEIPTFAWLLFARETSSNPREFFRNHLNAVGDSSVLEELELFLLSHTLGIHIKVIQPFKVDEEDYVTSYCSENQSQFPIIHLVAEDDHHYNIIS